MTTDKTTKLSAIDLAIAAAKARKASRVQVDDESTPFESAPKASKPRAAKAPSEPKPKAAPKRAAKATSDDAAKAHRIAERVAAKAEREMKQAQILQEREARKAAREAERAAKAAAKPVRKPAHMKKVERAAAMLPRLSDDSQLQVNEIVANFSADQITAIALHLQHHNRVAATQRSVTVSDNLEIGNTVRIIGGDPRYIGMTGTVDTVRRIRCFVNVPGVRKPVYCFIADVEQVADAAEAVAV
jgi:hypothetical protein